MADGFERLFQEIRDNTSRMAETLISVKKDTSSTRELTEQSTAATSEAAQVIETENARNEADTEPAPPARGSGGADNFKVVTVLEEIKEILEEQGSEEGEGGLPDWLNKFNPFKGGAGPQLQQTGGFIYPSPTQAFQNGGGVFKVPGNSTGDNHNMLLPQGSFVLNRNASKALMAQSGGIIPPPMAPMGYQEGSMVPVKTESQEMVFGPGSFSSLIPILNQVIPRFQAGGIVEHLHGDPTRKKGYDKGGHGLESNAHDHFAFSSKELRLQVQEMLAAGQTQSGRAYQIGSTTGGKHSDNSYHYSGQAFDIPWSQFGSGPLGEKDYQQSQTLYKDVQGILAKINGGKGGQPGSNSSDTQARVPNFGNDYALQERMLFDAAGGYTPYSAPNAFGAGLLNFDESKQKGNFKQLNDYHHSFFPGFTSDVHSSGNSNYMKNESNTNMYAGALAQITSILSGGGMGMLTLLGKGVGGLLMQQGFDGLKGSMDALLGTNFSGKAQKGSNSAVDSGTGDSANATKPYDIAESIGFSKKDWDIYRNAVGQIESSNSYDPKGDGSGGGSGGHYDGRWQLGKAAKMDAAAYLGEDFPGHGPSGSVQRKQYISDHDMQERYFAAFTAKNHEYLTGHPKYDALPTKQKFEVLGYAHNQGAGGARSWLNTGVVGQDGFGTKADKYSKALRAAYKNQSQQSQQRQTGGGIMGGGLEPVKVESGELIFSPGSFGPEIPQLNKDIPRFQSGGMIGGQQLQMGGNVRSSNPQIDNTNIQNFVSNRFTTANQTHNDMAQQSQQPIVIPVPTVGHESSNVPTSGGGAQIPSLTASPSNHIVSSLMMSSYSLMQRIG